MPIFHDELLAALQSYKTTPPSTPASPQRRPVSALEQEFDAAFQRSRTAKEITVDHTCHSKTY